MQWEKLIFLLTEASFNHAVKLHGHWFVQWLKNEPMARQRSCKSLWRRSPPEWAEPSGYTSGCFAIGNLGFFDWSNDYTAQQICSTRSISQGTEVTIVTGYVPYQYSISYCVLLTMLWEHSSITLCWQETHSLWPSLVCRGNCTSRSNGAAFATTPFASFRWSVWASPDGCRGAGTELLQCWWCWKSSRFSWAEVAGSSCEAFQWRAGFLDQ